METETTPNAGYTYRDLVGRCEAGMALIDFYASRYPHSSEATWRGRVAAGDIYVNDVPATPERRLDAGDRLAYVRRPWIEPSVPWSVRVIHEDADCAVVDKPSGLPVIPDAHHLEHTLLSWVRGRFGASASPAHRLDRGTSGLVLIGRRREARRLLSSAFAGGRVTRRYLARVRGTALPDTLEIDAPIGVVDYPPTRKLHAACADGAPSLTRVRVLTRDTTREESLVEIELLTGRPHQIRVHLACVGAPLTGDSLYGAGGRPPVLVAGERPPLPGDGGYFLHAHLLAFDHPSTGSRVALRAEPRWPLRDGRGVEGREHTV